MILIGAQWLKKEWIYNGHLYCYKFEFLCNAPLTCVDIHGLGAGSRSQAVWHCVLSTETCLGCFSNKVEALPWDLNCMEVKEVTIKLPYGNGEKRKVSCLKAHNLIYNFTN